jgi:hypothetical protein
MNDTVRNTCNPEAQQRHSFGMSTQAGPYNPVLPRVNDMVDGLVSAALSWSGDPAQLGIQEKALDAICTQILRELKNRAGSINDLMNVRSMLQASLERTDDELQETRRLLSEEQQLLSVANRHCDELMLSLRRIETLFVPEGHDRVLAPDLPLYIANALTSDRWRGEGILERAEAYIKQHTKGCGTQEGASDNA